MYFRLDNLDWNGRTKLEEKIECTQFPRTKSNINKNNLSSCLLVRNRFNWLSFAVLNRNQTLVTEIDLTGTEKRKKNWGSSLVVNFVLVELKERDWRDTSPIGCFVIEMYRSGAELWLCTSLLRFQNATVFF